ARKGDEALRGARARPTGRTRDVNVAREVEALDAGLGEPAGCELALDGTPRDERNPEAGLDRAPHRLLQPELERNVEVAKALAALAQLVLDHLPDAGSL